MRQDIFTVTCDTAPPLVVTNELSLKAVMKMIGTDGTNRRPIDTGDPSKGYSGARDNTGVVHYGACRVFIPKSHKIGSIGSPWWKRLLTLTDDRLKLLGVSELERSAYWEAISA